ncbi:zinc metalloproteinase nas-7-like [Phlebotomus argentipes]|uniref:zinc metalloproteinase nas-7-like n=1 Tax=Phlebotomus argentipes TaxID=94469 RepID=UPI0028933F2E|nr:zinc metalloproteinase nas-7-like [Phlebotomus argentipes]
MKQIQNVSCIKFKKKTKETNYLLIKRGFDGCKTSLGYAKGVQSMYIDMYDCSSIGLLLHQFLHVLGFVHTHTRFDRNGHIAVRWRNIAKSDWDKFQMLSDEFVSTYGTVYDYKSVMHWPAKAYTKNRGITLYPFNLTYLYALGHATELSEGDTLRLNRMYNCKRKRGM